MSPCTHHKLHKRGSNVDLEPMQDYYSQIISISETGNEQLPRRLVGATWEIILNSSQSYGIFHTYASRGCTQKGHSYVEHLQVGGDYPVHLLRSHAVYPPS